MSRSKGLFEEAGRIIPGGVNSPVRAFQAVGKEYPVFIKSAKGSKLVDEDDRVYIDYIGSWGPMILGHNPDQVLNRVKEQLDEGSSFGLPTKGEIELAKKVVELVPSVEKVRLTTSGTEATMSAIRLARAVTKRNKIIKFDGCYHGHSDSLLVKAGSGLLTSGHQDSNGITEGTMKDTLVLPFGEIDAVKNALQENQDIACIILEPVPANMGLICTEKEYLVGLRDLCDQYGVLLIFDEVISGFRLSLGGAQERYGVIPDLTTLGKIIGGGFPVGAFGGKKELMDHIAPVGDVYHAGTLSGNPISVCAGLETLTTLQENHDLYQTLEKRTKNLVKKIKEIAKAYDVSICINQLGSLFTLFFTISDSVTSLNDVLATSTENYNLYFHVMLEEGIMVPPSKFEAHFVSSAHMEEDLELTLSAIDKAFKAISERS
ncbi:glutamate-1-semialdehyde 2,1-aminomutase [Vallitalea okinawensis]|uniref:glutamate-1-semialdehyde 2,1-aminomutase n=1 Tax=Vallitalea okinawensis TaxID=2078660 RepID=UPI000CFDC068|nr:glutamate-1-semialdehyde 2,1-aminomutase [Vallitalea okinawensis]